MPAYALVGATGATGSSVLRHLLTIHSVPTSSHGQTTSNPNSPNQTLHVSLLIRAKPKLLSLFPALPSFTSQTHPNLKLNIIEGSATNPSTLDKALDHCSVIFMCVGANTAPIGHTLVRDTAAAIVASLRRLRGKHQKRNGYHPPTIIQLRSASLNPPLAAQIPKFVSRTVEFCLAATYDDVRAACAVYGDAARENLLDFVLVDPPTLHDAFGSEATGYRIIEGSERQAVCLSYADLGTALCEVAERRGEYSNTAVGVTATGHVRTSWGVLLGYLFRGGLGHLVHMAGGGENVVVVASCVGLVLAAVACYL
ncbi:hypothetical protein BJX64DRAFT_302147 [Aspergillus heterothallicus]